MIERASHKHGVFSMESLTALPSVEGVVDALRAAKDSSNELVC